MPNKNLRRFPSVLLLSALLLLLGAATTQAKIEGLVGDSQATPNTFNFTAKADHITTGEGNTVLIWGYADEDGHQGRLNGRAQYPGPTIIVDAGDPITINLGNTLPQPTSMIFPGATSVSASGDQAGSLTWEAANGGAGASYTVTYDQPGTYTYYSGTNTDLQVEMGLVGAVVVRPSGFATMDPPQAYDHADTAYDYEVLFLLTDMDPTIHDLVEFGRIDEVDMTERYATYWFINGRNGPDTLLDSYAAWLPTQPYNCLPRIRPCEKVLLRLIGGGLDGHPFHTHGNNITVLAKDGRLLSTAAPDVATAGADLAFSDFTQAVFPGETFDAVFTWTGHNMGWDFYGHAEGDPLETCEDPNDHGKPMPVELPGINELTFSPFYSGSPYLGGDEFLPPGEGGFNQNGGFYYMWHSHNEKELTNWDIFPGGMLTFLIIEPPSVTNIQ